MNTTFKLGLRLVGCMLVMLTLAGCDENEAPLQFDVVDNTTPEVITVDYYCPDFGWFPGDKEYFVRTDFTAGSVTLKCNNCDRGGIKIETELSKPCVIEGGGSSSCEATAEETGIYVSLSHAGNMITIDFADVSPADSYSYYGVIKAYGKVGREDKVTVINVTRRNNN
ncbi:MAG: hypothetical protein K2M68_09260 [Muribaculaceae bacterium]|nr:hypothetical protein [Muribaculaceae bacterium]